MTESHPQSVSANDATDAGADAAELDFATGVLDRVALATRRQRTREYTLLVIILVLTSVPYILLAAYYPAATALAAALVIVFKTVVAFFTSARTGVAHHVRFLLAGGNPFGMAAGSSMIFGGVDAVIDWHEDRLARATQPLTYWGKLILKFLVTPIGALFLLCEYAWDLPRPSVPKIDHSPQMERTIRVGQIPRSDLPRKIERPLLRRSGPRTQSRQRTAVPMEPHARDGFRTPALRGRTARRDRCRGHQPLPRGPHWPVIRSCDA